MLRTLKISIISLTLVLASAAAAFAYPVLGPGKNHIEFINYENVMNLSENGQITTGTTFYGILRAQTIRNQGNPIWSSDPIADADGVDSLTGYFLTTVTAVNDVPDSPFDQIILGPSASDPWGILTADELAAGVALKMWADDGMAATALDATSVANGLSTATDGQEWLSLTMTDGYWWSSATVNPAGVNGLIGDSFFGLNYYDTFGTVTTNLKVNDAGESLFDLDVNVYGESTISTNTDPATQQWAFASDDPAVLATPEPATLLITGAGLLGLAGMRRRRNKMAG